MGREIIAKLEDDLRLGLERNCRVDADCVDVLKAVLNEALYLMTDEQVEALSKSASFTEAIRGIGEMNR